MSILDGLQESRGTCAVAIVYVLFCGTISLLSDGLLDSGDALVHYQYSKYSWKHPELFLDHWAKPLFTLVSSPFAQIGFKGMVIFNLLCSWLTLILLSGIAKHFDIQSKWVVLVCLCGVPVYYRVVLSGSTEVLFSLLLVAGLHLLLSKRLIWAAVVFSFLPYSRPEAYLVLPSIIGYVMVKDIRRLPFFGVGTIVYALIGLVVFDDFFWFYNQDPYIHQSAETYGTGSPFHFLNGTKNIHGIPISMIFLISLPCIAFRTFMRHTDRESEIWLLIILPILFVFIGHSVMWWKGLNGSLGLVRVLATVSPLVALVSGSFISWLSQRFEQRSIQRLVIIVSSVTIVVVFIDRVPIQITTGPKEKVTLNAAEWLSQKREDRKLYYLEPLFSYQLELDPFDEKAIGKLWSLEGNNPSASINPGDWLVWDSHYGPQEAAISKESLMSNEDLTLVKSWIPEPAIKIFNGRAYEIHVFERK